MTDFIEEIPQPPRRIVEGKREIGDGLSLRVYPIKKDGVIMSVRGPAGGRSQVESGFCYSASTLRNLIAALTEIAEVLEQES